MQDAKLIMGEVLRAKLLGAAYQPDSASSLAREIADETKRCIRGELSLIRMGRCLAHTNFSRQKSNPQNSTTLLADQPTAEPWAQRYKLVVQTVVGEQRGEGCSVAARCFWDHAADGWAQEVFANESLYCVVVAFGCYLY